MGMKYKNIFSKATSVLLTVSVIISSNGVAMASDSIQKESVDSKGVIEISTEDELRKIAEDLSGDYVLTDSINLENEWTPLGDNDKPFTGTFDGNGHVIRGMDIDIDDSEQSSFDGLFGVVEDAHIKNVALEDISIESDTKGGVYIGGIAGKVTDSSISDVYVSGNILVDENTAQTIGGIAGAVFNTDSTDGYEALLRQCMVRVNVTHKDSGEVGVVVGWINDVECMQNCYTDNQNAMLTDVEYNQENNRTLTGEALQNQDNYIGFDFDTVWEMTDNGAKLITQIADDIADSYSEKFSYVSSDENESKETIEKDASEDVAETVPEVIAYSYNGVSSLPEIPELLEEKDIVEGNNNSMPLASADEQVSGDFTYTVSGNDATITGYTGSGGSVVIPGTIDGYTVTGIGSYAFNGCTKITEISIPNTITSIGYGAFSSCTSLETVNMSYNSTVEYETSIESQAFSGCTSLKNVNLSENVTSIGSQAFGGCTALETLILPESLTTMGYEMIESTAISSITIPKNVKSCRGSSYSGPLANCKTLKTVTFEEGMTSIPGDILASRDYTSYVTKVNIPESVEEIGSCAFYKCENIDVSVLPSKLKIIGSYAFYNCVNIDVSVLPSKLKTIGSYAFNGCTKITEISIPNTITSIGYGAFSSCTSLETVNMSYNSMVEYEASIESQAFSGCTSLKNVNLSENITSIGGQAFSGCTALETLILPESLTYIIASRIIEEKVNTDF